MKEIKELQGLIIEWAKEKNLNDYKAQYVKCHEEIGELARGILKNDLDFIYDSIGDVAVTFIIFYDQLNDENVDIVFREFDNDVLEVSSNELFAVLISELTKPTELYTYLEIMAKKYDKDLKYCLNLAWNEIKDRQGITKNGTFIKN